MLDKIKTISLNSSLPWIYVIAGLIGIYCAFTLSNDKILLLENPKAALNCSIDPIIACGSVVSSKQGSAFGFPNPFLGLAGFAAVATVGVTMLAGAKFKRWFWLIINSGLLLALLFVHWLFYQSVYNIGALCIYCMIVWVVTITSFWYTTLYVIDKKFIILPKQIPAKIYPWIRKHHLDILILWFLIIFLLIMNHFWYYYGTKL